MPSLDLGTVLVALVGIGAAVALAIFAGTISARVFFDASRDSEEKL